MAIKFSIEILKKMAILMIFKESVTSDCLVGIEVQSWIVDFLPGKIDFLSAGDTFRTEGEIEFSKTDTLVGLSKPWNDFKLDF